MAGVVAEFFNIVQAGYLPPSNLQELVPYILIIVTGITLVSGVFGVLGKLMQLLLSMAGWSGK